MPAVRFARGIFALVASTASSRVVITSSSSDLNSAFVEGVSGVLSSIKPSIFVPYKAFDLNPPGCFDWRRKSSYVSTSCAFSCLRNTYACSQSVNAS